jgi:ribonuclease HI
LNYRYTIITPEDWHYARAIRVEFAYERPSFDVLREVPEKVFKSDFDFSMPAFIETDGACAGNNNKESPGGWGAIIVNGNRICKKFGSKNDTSNNEMEYQAMLEALSLIPQPPKPNLRPLVVIESDSQTCIDALSKFRFRWANRRWRREDGQPVENAEQIIEIGQRLDRMRVGFWKIKGHSKDPWNDMADALAVKGRNQGKQNVTVRILFRPIVDRKEKLWAIPRLSLHPHSNIYDIWPHLVEKWGDNGEPEDYEIWEDQSPLRRP